MKDYKLFINKAYPDNRGYLFESFHRAINEELGEVFCQDNISYSHKGVVRGLHYQWSPPLGKLVQTISGKIVDYIVDIRLGSPFYGRFWEFELSETNRNTLWVPPGYAHGFEALENSYVMYKYTSYYNEEGESTINIFDPSIKINLKTDKSNVIMNYKDSEAQSFIQYTNKPMFIYEEN